MGYGLGIFLIALGAILALAIGDSQLGPINIYLIGIILAIAGVAVVVMAAIQQSQQNNSGGGKRVTRETTTHPDGSQTVRETE